MAKADIQITKRRQNEGIFIIPRATAIVMGGRKRLNKYITNDMDLYNLERCGVPIDSVGAVKKALGINEEDIANVLGISESTLLRKKKGRIKLSSGTSGRLIRVARIFALTEHALGGKKQAAKWLKRPQFGLYGKAPLEIIKTEAGAREVENVLMRIEYGVLP